METEVANLFAEQVSLGMLVQNLVYASGIYQGGIYQGLMLIDVGGVRRRNIFNATIEKMVGFFIGFTAYFLIGFAFWASQYYIMVDYTLVDTIKDWWTFKFNGAKCGSGSFSGFE